ncbi:hypothetical protein GGI09_000066 [Coemansia sp. S100]|nr:hypothetical protein GGI09_000066 [Coemansia sp. S100]KAJ2105416.1 hypothetical protein GGI16_002367 [Coemansia sp. S142-1]
MEVAERKKGMMASRRTAPTDVSKKRKTDEDGNDSNDEIMVVEAQYSGNDGEVQCSAAVHKLLKRHAGNRPLYDSSDDDNGDKNNSGCSAVPPKESSITKNNLCAADSLSDPEQFVNEIKRTQFASDDKVKCVTLGSRMQLCVNDRALLGVQSVYVLNKRCLVVQLAREYKERTMQLPATTAYADARL